MEGKRKHIVFFTPTLNRTGSEIVLFNLLPFALKDFKVTVVSKYRGDLYDELPEGVEKHFFYKKQFGGFLSRLSNKFRSIFVVDRILNKYLNATWYINTIMLTDIVNYACDHGIKTIVHLHELQQMYTLLSEDNKEQLAEFPEIIANSQASAEVIRTFGREKPVEIIYPSLDFDRIKISNADLRSSLKIPSNVFVWVMSGTLDRNKDPFLFVEIAKQLKSKTTDFRMLWLGASPGQSSIGQEFLEYIRKNDCEDVILWVKDPGSRYYDHLALANGFVLTSQFESFSLVTLEALYLQLPVVANPCIGVSEILQDRFGYVAAAKNNATEMAAAMQEYMSGKRVADKEALRNRALEFNIDRISKQWLEWLKKQV